MSNYRKLKELSKKYKGKEAIDLAREFGINVYDETTCNNAFANSNNPLLRCDAVLAMIGNKYVVYYKEGKYKNYYILHELCHYILKHNADGSFEEKQANTLACMILLPDKILKKDVFTISTLYNIPCEYVYEHINYIRQNSNIFAINKFIRILLTVCVAFVIFISGICVNNMYIQKRNISQKVYSTVEDNKEDVESNVFVTLSGHKYHKKDCFHIKNREIKTITIGKAKSEGYTACKDCFN